MEQLDDKVKSSLSNDQRYMAEIAIAVQNGPLQFSELLAKNQPGKVHSARWVTTANTILRLYCQTTQPSLTLKRLAGFVVNVYCPTFFAIKKNWQVTDGPKNLCWFLQLANSFLTPEEKNIAPVVKNNAYYCHPESILLTSLTDERENVRATAAKHILDDRERRKEMFPREIRVLPLNINFGATDYLNLVNFKQISPSYITESPLTMNYTNEEIVGFIRREKMKATDIPVHSQSVERLVADVTNASKFANTHEKRHAKILATHENRKKFPTKATKKDFQK